MHNYFKSNVSLLIKKEKFELIFCLVCERQKFLCRNFTNRLEIVNVVNLFSFEI